ncbi:MAG: MFS transporter [Geminicoccaceae bacterium]|nr:MFS transporter [Geminicoccaceae bacterium]
MTLRLAVRGGLNQIGATLRETTFGRYVAGNAISLVGNWMQRTAVGWLAWDLTGSVAWLGIVAFSDLFPTLIMGPIGGVLADRHDRVRQIFACQTALLLVAVALWLLTAADMVGIAGLLAITTLHGLIVGLNQPARLALVPSLVAPDRLRTAIAINSIVFNTARFIGPAVAGLLIATAGLDWTFFANALSYLPFLVALTTLRPIGEQRSKSRASFIGQLAEGLRFVAAEPSMRLLFALVIAAALLLRPLGELLPALADGVFARGATGLATLSAALGAGAVAGGIVMAMRREALGVDGMTAWFGALAVLLLLLSAAPAFWTALPLVGACGFCLIASGVAAQTLMQERSPPDLRGRVMSLFGITFRAGPAVGALILGFLADLIGLRPALALGALTFVAAALALRHHATRTPSGP